MSIIPVKTTPAVTLPSLDKRIAKENKDKSHLKNKIEDKQSLFFLLNAACVTRYKKVYPLSWQRFPPLLSQLAVLLPVCSA